MVFPKKAIFDKVEFVLIDGDNQIEIWPEIVDDVLKTLCLIQIVGTPDKHHCGRPSGIKRACRVKGHPAIRATNPPHRRRTGGMSDVVGYRGHGLSPAAWDTSPPGRPELPAG